MTNAAPVPGLAHAGPSPLAALSQAAFPSAGARVPLADVMKTIAAQCIVLHHLAAYGPMSQAAQPHAGGAVEFVYDYGRAAVYLFLVLGGYLAASALMPAPGRWAPVLETRTLFGLVARRWLRLAWPYWFALIAAVAAAAIARGVFVDSDTPAYPDLAAFLANASMLQDIVGVGALSAGVWYVAIDLQLYTVFAVFARSCRAFRGPLAGDAGVPGTIRMSGPVFAAAAIGIICAATLSGWLLFGQDDGLDMWAAYFFGAYGVGVLARWGCGAAAEAAPGSTTNAMTGTTLRWWALIAGLCTLALVADPRVRTFVTAGTAVILLSGWSSPWMRSRVFEVGARISYSVFLIHYPVSLLANAFVYQGWGGDPVASAQGLGAAWLASNLAGWAVYRFVEARTPRLGEGMQSRR